MLRPWVDENGPCGKHVPSVRGADVFNWGPLRPPVATLLASSVAVSSCHPFTNCWYCRRCCQLAVLPSSRADCRGEDVVRNALCKQPPMPRLFVTTWQVMLSIVYTGVPVRIIIS